MTVATELYIRGNMLKNREIVEDYFPDYINWIKRHTKWKVSL